MSGAASLDPLLLRFSDSWYRFRTHFAIADVEGHRRRLLDAAQGPLAPDEDLASRIVAVLHEYPPAFPCLNIAALELIAFGDPATLAREMGFSARSTSLYQQLVVSELEVRRCARVSTADARTMSDSEPRSNDTGQEIPADDQAAPARAPPVPRVIESAPIPDDADLREVLRRLPEIRKTHPNAVIRIMPM